MIRENKEMSRSRAAFELLELARGGLSRTQVEALQLGVRALVKRHFDCMKNRAVRQARKQQAGQALPSGLKGE